MKQNFIDSLRLLRAILPDLFYLYVKVTSSMLIVLIYTALIWQKEASDIPSKFELWMFSYLT